MSKPITPDQITPRKQDLIPDAVIDVFNDLIAKHWNGNRSVVKQKDVVALLVANHNMTREDIYNNHYLDVEDIFRRAGWHVEYDKPGYNETYDATFIFKKKS